MEWLNSISDILSIVFGGTLISIVTWKFARRKAAAEALKAEADAKQAEAEAKKAEIEAAQEKEVEKIEREALDGEELEVNYNFSILSNAVSNFTFKSKLHIFPFIIIIKFVSIII